MGSVITGFNYSFRYLPLGCSEARCMEWECVSICEIVNSKETLDGIKLPLIDTHALSHCPTKVVNEEECLGMSTIQFCTTNAWDKLSTICVTNYGMDSFCAVSDDAHELMLVNSLNNIITFLGKNLDKWGISLEKVQAVITDWDYKRYSWSVPKLFISEFKLMRLVRVLIGFWTWKWCIPDYNVRRTRKQE